MTEILHEPGGPYIVGDKKYPGVTTVLETLFRRASTCNQDRDYYLERGSAVHKAVWLDVGGGDGSGLAIEYLDPEIIPFVRAFREFRGLHPFEVVMSERSVISRVYGYGGTLDLLVKWLKKGTDKLGLLDIKSGSKAPVGTRYQTAAYRRGLCETAKIDKRIVTTHSLLLTPDGKPHLETYKHPDTDFQGFLHYLGCYKIEVNEGIRKPWN